MRLARASRRRAACWALAQELSHRFQIACPSFLSSCLPLQHICNNAQLDSGPAAAGRVPAVACAVCSPAGTLLSRWSRRGRHAGQGYSAFLHPTAGAQTRRPPCCPCAVQSACIKQGCSAQRLESRRGSPALLSPPLARASAAPPAATARPSDTRSLAPTCPATDPLRGTRCGGGLVLWLGHPGTSAAGVE